jgi:hypothetical protein
MATILLSYVGSDQAVAKRLLTVLERAGHKVVGADLGRAALQRTDVVVVIWSPAALASPYVYEQARVALSSHCLVQVTTAELDVAQLPAVFRTHALVRIANTDAVIKEIDSVLGFSPSGPLLGMPLFADKGHREDELLPMSSQEQEKEPAAASDKLALELDDIFGQTAATTPSPAAPPAPLRIPLHLSKTALERQAGQLNHKIPCKMRVGATEIVEVRLGRARQDIAMELVGSGDLTAEELPIVETITMALYGSPDAFRIMRQSRPTQLVKSSLIWSAAFDEQKFGRWLWHVTPKKSGTHELVVKVSADLSDSRGVATTEPCGNRTFSVKVRVNYAHTSVRVAKWTAAGAVSALAGAFTQEIWWPWLKAFLVGTGLLG